MFGIIIQRELATFFDENFQWHLYREKHSVLKYLPILSLSHGRSRKFLYMVQYLEYVVCSLVLYQIR
jgi:hypothetical protein